MTNPIHTVSILLADNDTVIRDCLRRAFEADPRLRIRWEAENGLQALLLARQHRPHLVLMESQMPRMDGLEVTRCLRRSDRRARIVLMSVYEQHGASALAAGADAFVTKDAGCEAICAAVRLLLEAAGPTEQ